MGFSHTEKRQDPAPPSVEPEQSQSPPAPARGGRPESLQGAAAFGLQLAAHALGDDDDDSDRLLGEDGLIDDIFETREEAIADQQQAKKVVNKIVDQGAAKQVDPDAGPTDRGNLLVKSCRWIKEQQAFLYVLTPTHDAKRRAKKLGKKGQLAYFDQRLKYDEAGGAYAKKKKNADGIYCVKKGVAGRLAARLDGDDAVVLFSPHERAAADVEDTLIHEVQHDADRYDDLADDHEKLDVTVEGEARQYDPDNYLTEFRAYWSESGDAYRSADEPADNGTPVVWKPDTGEALSEPTCFSNGRQEDIFRHIVNHYPGVAESFCRHPGFRALVHATTQPASFNPGNSAVIDRMLDALVALVPGLPADDPGLASLWAAAAELDDLDREFLSDPGALLWTAAARRLSPEALELLRGVVAGAAVAVAAAQAGAAASGPAQGGEPLNAPREPFERGVTRGDFVWAAVGAIRPGDFKRRSRDELIASAAAEGTLKDRLEEKITRAEAAAVIARMLGYGKTLPAEGIAYFSDVFKSHWFFEEAHLVRQHGIFKGGGSNLFRGLSKVTTAEAGLVLGRAAKAPGKLSPEDQSPGTAPLLEPGSGLEPLGQEGPLGAEQIKDVRDVIDSLPAAQQEELYQQVAAKVGFRSQLDNAGGNGVKGYDMCGYTSLAMALNQLGIGADEAEKQFEDQLLALGDEKGFRRPWESSATLGNIAGELGAGSLKRTLKSTGASGFGSGGEALSWFTEQRVAEVLGQGASAVVGIMTSWGGHIVRLQSVTSEGLLVDDPYGRVARDAAGNWSYGIGNDNSGDLQDAEESPGKDNLWSWEQVAGLMSSSSRYVQFLWTGDEPPSALFDERQA